MGYDQVESLMTGPDCLSERSNIRQELNLMHLDAKQQFPQHPPQAAIGNSNQSPISRKWLHLVCKPYGSPIS